MRQRPGSWAGSESKVQQDHYKKPQNFYWTAPKIKGIEGDEISSPPLAVNDKHRQNRQYLTGPKFGLRVRFEIKPVISGVLHQRVFAFQIAKPLKRIGAIPHGLSVFTLDPRKVKIADLANQARNRGGASNLRQGCPVGCLNSEPLWSY